ncbi:MAG: hypothetical protein MZV65_01420 [Chromatiales bacterium]|nr:hypothetical protein [Chromatiales bacterium]
MSLLAASPLPAEDIDIFVGGSGTVSSSRPNVLIVLDNTSNWARQSQKWPGGLTQGQSEVRAIRNSLAKVVDKVNVGLLMFVTQGNANDNGGYVRHHLQIFDDGQKTIFDAKLDAIFDDINSPIEKRNSNRRVRLSDA